MVVVVIVMVVAPVIASLAVVLKAVGVKAPSLTEFIVPPGCLQLISACILPPTIEYFVKAQLLFDFSMSCGPRTASAGVMQ